MYYLNKSVLLQQNLKFLNLTYHAISQIRVDYINKEIEVQIASFSGVDLMKAMSAENITAIMFNYEKYDWTKDINYNCLLLLSEMSDAVFYGAELLEIDITEDIDENIDELAEAAVEQTVPQTSN